MTLWWSGEFKYFWPGNPGFDPRSQNPSDDDCFCCHFWRNNMVIAFGTLSFFLPTFAKWVALFALFVLLQAMKNRKRWCRSSVIGIWSYPAQYPRSSTCSASPWRPCFQYHCSHENRSYWVTNWHLDHGWAQRRSNLTSVVFTIARLPVLLQHCLL